MEITGTQHIAAPRADVWNALNDPAVLQKCLPGCESVERCAADEFKVIVVSAIGPLKARFNGLLRLTEAQAPNSYVMVFEGQGGAIGFGKGSSSVTLKETDAGTELSYSAKAQVGGKLAQVGSRLIDSVARKMSDDFFKAFRKQFASPESPDVTGIPATAVAGKAAVESPTTACTSASTAPSSDASTSRPDSITLVPGWWLAVAMALGAAVAIAAAVFIH